MPVRGARRAGRRDLATPRQMQRHMQGEKQKPRKPFDFRGFSAFWSSQ